jgi:hypothetical protein
MTQDEIRSMFDYEPANGMLRQKAGRKPYPWHGAGKARRYLVHSNGKRSIYLHRAVWLYHYGYLPAMLDHINGDMRDNRIENLRECTNAQNQYNGPRKISNSTGHKGVIFHPACRSRPWQARITVAGRKVSLGYYETKELAAAAYELGAAQHAGEFARKD